MLRRLKIENFIRIAHVDLMPERPVVAIFGENESGKSSLAEALRFVFRDDSPRVRLKKDRDQLVHGGARNGAVLLEWDNNRVLRSLRDGKATGDTQCLPTEDDVADVCLGSKSFAELDDKARRALVMRLSGVDLSVDSLAKKLRQKEIDAVTIKKYRPLLKSGLAAGHARAKKAATEARGAWREITGETYGAVKAETWQPGEAVMDDTKANAALSALDEKITTIEARRDKKITTIEAKRDDKIKPVLAQIAALEQQLTGPEPLVCPHCGRALLYGSGSLQAYEGKADRKKLRADLKIASTKRREIVESFHDERQQISNGFRDQLSQLEQDKAEVRSEIVKAEQTAKKGRRAAELHEEAKTSDRLAVLLGEGPDGIAAELIADSLKPLNERLLTIGTELGWTPATIRADMSVHRIDGYAYRLLSRSARWRADMMLAVLVSELAQFPWLVLDDMDTLEPKDRMPLLRWLDGYAPGRADEATIVVLAALKATAALPDLEATQSYWIDQGAVDDHA